MSEAKSFVIMLRPAPKYGEPATDEKVGEHFAYLQSLQKEGTLIMAGRFSDVLVGLVIIQTETREKAETIMKNDPAVSAQIFHAELYEWRIALR